MIVPLTTDIAHEIAENLRERDLNEVIALLPMGDSVHAWASRICIGDHKKSFAALVQDGDRTIPVAMGGIVRNPANPYLATSWMVGTNRKLEAGVAIFAAALRIHNEFRERGVRKFQCYCLESPDEASDWLHRIGYSQEGKIVGYGNGGENFLLWGLYHGR